MTTRRLAVLPLFWVQGFVWRSGADPSGQAVPAARRLPNFIIIYADDLGDSLTRRTGKNVRPAGRM